VQVRYVTALAWTSKLAAFWATRGHSGSFTGSGFRKGLWSRRGRFCGMRMAPSCPNHSSVLLVQSITGMITSAPWTAPQAEPPQGAVVRQWSLAGRHCCKSRLTSATLSVATGPHAQTDRQMRYATFPVRVFSRDQRPSSLRVMRVWHRMQMLCQQFVPESKDAHFLERRWPTTLHNRCMVRSFPDSDLQCRANSSIGNFNPLWLFPLAGQRHAGPGFHPRPLTPAPH